MGQVGGKFIGGLPVLKIDDWVESKFIAGVPVLNGQGLVDSKFVAGVPVLNGQDLVDSKQLAGVLFPNGQNQVDAKFVDGAPMHLIIGALLATLGTLSFVVFLRSAPSEEPLAKGAEMATNAGLTEV